MIVPALTFDAPATQWFARGVTCATSLMGLAALGLSHYGWSVRSPGLVVVGAMLAGTFTVIALNLALVGRNEDTYA